MINNIYRGQAAMCDNFIINCLINTKKKNKNQTIKKTDN